MEFEWDETKRRGVLAARQIDFAEAALVFDDAKRLTFVDAKREYGETRYLTLGRVGSQDFIVAYTMRAGKIRIITAWRAGENGRRRYQALFDRRIAGEE